MDAPLVEIFSSVQGEGPYVGTPMLFVRFHKCDLTCAFCDTPETFKSAPTLRVEDVPFSGVFSYYPNPISISQLLDLISRFPDEYISLTGGEPLIYVDFLLELMPELKKQNKKILLETTGTRFTELQKIAGIVDIISMDIKLPSVARLKPLWEAHEIFLKTAVASSAHTYVKIVLSDGAIESELVKAIDLVKQIAPGIAIILQPASPSARIKASMQPKKLASLLALARANYHDVRLIPQLHKMMGVL